MEDSQPKFKSPPANVFKKKKKKKPKKIRIKHLKKMNSQLES